MSLKFAKNVFVKWKLKMLCRRCLILFSEETGGCWFHPGQYGTGLIKEDLLNLDRGDESINIIACLPRTWPLSQIFSVMLNYTSATDSSKQFGETYVHIPKS